MLKNYPIKFNDYALDFMPDIKVKPNTIATVYTSEGGTDEVQIVRNNKLSIIISVKVLENVLKKLYEFSLLESFNYSQYDPLTADYKVIKARIKENSFNYNLIKHSDKISVSNGIYKVSFTVEEF